MYTQNVYTGIYKFFAELKDISKRIIA